MESRREQRKFGLQFTVGMIILSTVIYWKHHGFVPGIWIPLGLAIFHLAGALLFPPALAPTHWLMPRLVKAITTAFAWVVMVLFYYVIFTPIALLLRLFGKDHIAQLEKKRPAWLDVEPSENDPARIEKLY